MLKRPYRFAAPMRLVFVPVLLLLSCQSTPRRRYSVLREPAPPAIDEAALLEELSLPPENVGYLVYDTERQRVVASHNPQSAFLPASVGKIATTIAALQVLGADHRFPTELATRGHWREGALEGDLYLKGGGDPLLTTAELMELVEALRRYPTRAVRGHFYFDASEYPERDRVHPMQDEDAVYNTSVGALSAEFNRLALNWHTDPKAGALEAYLVPSLGVARLELTPQKSDLPALTFREDAASDTWLLPPDLARDGKRELPVHHAGLFTAQLFAQLCTEQGIALPAPEPGVMPATARSFHTHWSAPLSELVARNLEWSNNLMAELLLLATARKLTDHATGRGAQGSAGPAASAAALTGWWKKQVPHAPWSGFVVENGSGLSPAARLSPSQAVAMLQWADRHTFSGKTYLSLLPISGLKGTLHQRMDLPQTALRVWAKTGTMKFGSALAGYFFSRENRKHVFAIFVSDLERRRALDAAAGEAGADAATSAGTDDARPRNRPGPSDPRAFRRLADAGDSWVDRGRRFQDGMLTKWILEN